MASIVLAEYAKLSPKAQRVFLERCLKNIPISSSFIDMLPFDSIEGGALSYKLPGQGDKNSPSKNPV